MAEEALAEKAPKTDTKTLSFELFKTGKTIEEIAAARGLAPGTIEGHLAHFIGLGELDIFTFLEREQVQEIEHFFLENLPPVSAAAKARFQEKYSYGQIRMVLAYMNLDRTQTPEGIE